MVTDVGILYGLNRHVGLHAAVSTKPVYQYQLSFDGRFGSYKSTTGDIFPGSNNILLYFFQHSYIVNLSFIF